MRRPSYAATDARYKRKYYHDCGVTILKPLHGAIPRLEETLETYLQLKWPRFELIFCVADANDDAVDVVRRLANKYPRVVQKVSVGNADYINPKLANLQSGYEAAKYDMIWMTDANVIASDGALQDMVDKCVGGSPLVHQKCRGAFLVQTSRPISARCFTVRCWNVGFSQRRTRVPTSF